MTEATSTDLTQVNSTKVSARWAVAQIALLTALTLGGSIAVTFVFVNISAGWIEVGRTIMGGGGAIVGALAIPWIGGVLWGLGIARLFNRGDRWQFARATGLTWGISVLLGTFALGGVNQSLGFLIKVGLPIHISFMASWSLAAGLLAGINAQHMVRRLGLVGRVGLAVGIGAWAAFLAVAIMMHLLDWKVGGYPTRAYKMSTVGVASNLGASLVGGAVMGWMLAQNHKSTLVSETVPATE